MAITLGLGVVFESMDKGLEKDLTNINKKLKEAKQNIDEFTKAQNENSDKQSKSAKDFKRVSDGIESSQEAIDSYTKSVSENTEALEDHSGEIDKLIKKTGALGKEQEETSKKSKSLGDSVRSFGSSFSSASNNVNKFLTGTIVNTFKDIRTLTSGDTGFSTLAKDMDSLSTKMGRVFDLKTVSKFNAQVKSGMLDFGVTVEQSSKMASAYSQFGLSSNQLLGSMPKISKLVGGLGLDAEKTAEYFGKSAAMFGSSADESMSLVENINQLGTSFGFLDMAEKVPDMFEQATENAMRFGVTSKKAIDKSTMSIAKQAAAFHSMGLSSSKAMQAAVDVSSKAADLREDFERMTLGLGGGEKAMQFVGQLTHATGIDQNTILEEMKKGATDSEAFAKFLGNAVDRAGADGSPEALQAQQRLLYQIKDMTSVETMAAISAYREKIKAKEAEAATSGAYGLSARNLISKQVGAQIGTLQKSEDRVKAGEAIVAATSELGSKKDVVAMANAKVAAQAKNAAMLAGDSLQAETMRTAVLVKNFGAATTIAYKTFGVKAAEASFAVGEFAGNVVRAQPIFEQAGIGLSLMTSAIGTVIDGFAWLVDSIGGVGSVFKKMFGGGDGGILGGGFEAILGGGAAGGGKGLMDFLIPKILPLLGPVAAAIGGLLFGGLAVPAFIDYLAGDKNSDGTKRTSRFTGEKVSWLEQKSEGLVDWFRESTFGGLKEKQMTSKEMDARQKQLEKETGMKVVEVKKTPLEKVLDGGNPLSIMSEGLKVSGKVLSEKGTDMLKSMASPLVPYATGTIKTDKKQSGAPVSASEPSQTYSSIDTSDLSSKMDQMINAISTLAAQQIKVEILGDVKKFLSVAMVESRRAVATSDSATAMNPT